MPKLKISDNARTLLGLAVFNALGALAFACIIAGMLA